MSVWVVRATWLEDEAEASEQWEVNAATAEDAVKAVAARLRFQPHHIEARRSPEPDDDAGVVGPSGNPARRVPSP
jgi:hypothetical protein